MRWEPVDAVREALFHKIWRCRIRVPGAVREDKDEKDIEDGKDGTNEQE